MRAWRALTLAAGLVLIGCAAYADKPVAQTTQRAPSLPYSTRLETFRSEEDFANYLGAVERAARARGFWWAGRDGLQYAQATPPPCPPQQQPCPPEVQSDSVVVTGSRVRGLAAAAPAPAQARAGASAAAATSITNVQSVGVDEGDIVKQFSHYLIVLQDGRLFSVDFRPNGQPGLALVNRANVYRHAADGVWYDEMLIQDHRIVVTGYSYAQGATEFSVFAINDDGRFAREATYYLSSNDYYDIENYASRLVGDKLVIYSPLYFRGADPATRKEWPLVRRWVSERDAAAVLSPGERLFEARDIYRPLMQTLEPTVHTVSVCPLGSRRAGDELDCHATAFVGPQYREFYVSPTAAYLWVAPSSNEAEFDASKTECTAGREREFQRGNRAALYQISLAGGPPRVMFVRGQPRDQFGLDENGREFRALLMWDTGGCDTDDNDHAMKYFSVSLRTFAPNPITATAERFIDAPNPGAAEYEERFTDRYVVYGGRTSWSSYPPEHSDAPATARVAAIPVDDPHLSTSLQAPHNVIRVERAGDNIVMSGYRTDAGLSVSLVDLRRTPRIASTAVLQGRYESEGRSHAFNSMIDTEGAGLMGVPTVTRTREGGRWWFRSRASDVSFLSVDADGRLHSAGPLTAGGSPQDPSYQCEASCIDWYGNSRPIFTDGRIFALTGTELIEGAIRNGRIQERRRANLTARPPRILADDRR